MALRDNKAGRLWAIDPHTRTGWNDQDSEDTHEILTANLRRFELTDYVEVVRQNSKEAAIGWTRPIDLLFIDGDHTYEGCKADWDLFTPFVSRFGVVVFHDTTWEYHKDSRWFRKDMGVPAVVDELRRGGYPVITWDRDCGVSLIQPFLGGVPLVGEIGDSNR